MDQLFYYVEVFSAGAVRQVSNFGRVRIVAANDSRVVCSVVDASDWEHGGLNLVENVEHVLDAIEGVDEDAVIRVYDPRRDGKHMTTYRHQWERRLYTVVEDLQLHCVAAQIYPHFGD